MVGGGDNYELGILVSLWDGLLCLWEKVGEALSDVANPGPDYSEGQRKKVPDTRKLTLFYMGSG